MFRITEQRSSGGLVLKLEGRFSSECVDELDTCWRSAPESRTGESIAVDLSDVCVVDDRAHEQLLRMHRAGVRFQARNCAMRELAREISEAH